MNRTGIRYKRILLFSLIVALITGALIYFLNDSIRETRKDIVRMRIQNVADYQILNVMRMYENYTASWGHLVRQNNGEIQNFSELAQKMYSEWDNPAIISIRLAPNGIVQSYVYPKEEDVYVNLFETADRKKVANYAKMTGEMTVSGPIKIYPRDEEEIIIRNPIYLNKGTETRGEFWGFSILILDHQQMLKYTELYSPNILYDYKVQHTIDISGESHLITESGPEPLEAPVAYEFPVADTTWMIQATWHGGWITKEEQKLELLVWLATVLISSLIYLFTERHRRLMVVSYTDALTQVMNRSALRVAFDGIYKKGKRINVMLFDVDFFKQINDGYGHAAGDYVLKQVGEQLSKIFRQELCYRYGGDEFLVIDESDAKTMQDKIVRLRWALDRIKYEDKELHITISGGCVSGVADSKDHLRDMLHAADKKLYEAKRSGKNSVQYGVMEYIPDEEKID